MCKYKCYKKDKQILAQSGDDKHTLIVLNDKIQQNLMYIHNHLLLFLKKKQMKKEFSVILFI